jgi:hypothetical protein
MDNVWLVVISLLVILICGVSLTLRVGSPITNYTERDKQYKINIVLITIMLLCILFNWAVIILHITMGD